MAKYLPYGVCLLCHLSLVMPVLQSASCALLHIYPKLGNLCVAVNNGEHPDVHPVTQTRTDGKTVLCVVPRGLWQVFPNVGAALEAVLEGVPEVIWPVDPPKTPDHYETLSEWLPGAQALVAEAAAFMRRHHAG